MFGRKRRSSCIALCGFDDSIIIKFQKTFKQMPKIKAKTEDESYAGPEPQIYRRYS
jgi:hypothetical protein